MSPSILNVAGLAWDDTPVLIVGGGPSGLLLAYLLAKQAVPSIVVERHLQRLGAPKAHALSPRSLEICRQFGLSVPEIRQHGSPRDEARHVRFVTSLSGEQVGSLPYERMDLDVLRHTPEILHNIPQPEFEALLAKRLAKDPLVTIRRGQTWVRSEEFTKNGVRRVLSTVADTATGEEFNILSRYTVACDGANSRVRRFLAAEMTGEDAYETLLTIHFNARLKPIVGERLGMLHWIMDPAARGFIIGYELDGNQVLIHNFDNTKRKVDDFTDDECRKIVTAAIGQETPFDIHSKAAWVLSRRVANEYRHGNIFLAGDAAHSFPPTGGLGLNSGIADVHNLAAKLAAVLSGTATDSLLETYDTERRPIALINSQQSVKNGTKIFALLRELKTTSDDPVEARKEMKARLDDPAIRAHIEELIEEQREHFDNLMLHIGYVYNASTPPTHASHFVPAYTAGARLPHAWIRSHTPLLLNPVDLTYLSDAPAGFAEHRQFSTLDLVHYTGLTVLLGSQPSLADEALLAELEHKKVAVRTLRLGKDFEVVDDDDGRAWVEGFKLDVEGAAVLVRPDQHVLATVAPGAMSATDAVTYVLEYYGRA